MEHKTFFSYGYVRFLATLALVALIAALGAYAHYTLRQAKYVMTGPTVISVTGTGEVLAKPDIGQFSFSVRAEGSDAASAQDASAQSINAIIDYLKDADVDEGDIKTQNYNLNPKYTYEERICPAGSFCPPGERVIDGYEVYQTVSVKVRDLDNAGNLITGVGERGATNISGLNFTIDDTDVLKAEAREQAIADAKEKAKQLADDLGVKLVRMTGFWEADGGYYEPMPYGFGVDMAMEESRAVSAPQLPTGENTVTSRVDISYEVK